MNLLEYEAKTILKKYSITVPRGFIIDQNDKNDKYDTSTPVVLKSQVPTGGRGKLGGIKIVENTNDIKSTVDELFIKNINSYLPKKLLAEEKLLIKRELYLAILVDRKTAGVRLLAHQTGGVEVEDNQAFKSWSIPYLQASFDEIAAELNEYYGLEDKINELTALVENLFICMKENDATLIEINPLILTTDDQLVAGDCKMILDDAATYRHADWEFEEKNISSNFVTINPKGTVATIANGAGLAMATVDAVYEAGLVPTNFLDVGGGASRKTLLASFRQIMDYKNVRAIVINIFAGITRSDEVAHAVIAAKRDIQDLPPLFIRIAGTNKEQADRLLEAASISSEASLKACIENIKAVLRG